MGLACDRDGYDLRAKQCSQCGSRGCIRRDHCKTVLQQPQWFQWFNSFPPILDVHAWGVPNRLFGATINSEGDAV